MDFLFKFFEQEDESIRKANMIAVRIVFWIGCISLSIWIGQECGYDSSPDFQFTASWYIKLFSEYYLILCVFTYVVINTSIRLILELTRNGVTKMRMKRTFKRLYSNKTASKDGNIFESRGFVNKIRTIVDNNSRSIYNYTETVFTLTLVYTLIISEKFPNVYHITIMLIFWAGTAAMVWLSSGFALKDEITGSTAKVGTSKFV